ncbi:MAG: Nif3-like dinuclear metal center hexameric protein, partial [Oscillospiraceae bacterium]
MPKKVLVKDILDFINSFAPFNSAEDFDNVGLLVGNKNAEVKKVLVCLDCTDEIISEAIDLGANLVITHHPVIFSPLKKMVSDSIVYRLVQNSISVISAHTNLDIAPMGVADSLAEKMELKNIQPFALGNVESYYKLSVLGQEKAVLDVKTAFLPY